jgi:hypothetical protein
MIESNLALDYAWVAAFDLIDCLRPVLRDEEVHDVFQLMQERIKAAIEAALVTHSRTADRITPSVN